MNAGTTMRARSDIRSRMASLIAVTLLIGFAGAVSMTAFVGAERAESAYARFRASTNEPAVIMFGGPVCPFSHEIDLDAMASLPQVDSMQAAWVGFFNATDRHGRPLFYADGSFGSSIVSVDLEAPDSVRPRLLSGRYPRAADETLIDWGFTEARQPSLGETFEVTMPKSGTQDALSSGTIAPDDLITVPLTAVGVAVGPGELDGTSGNISVTSAFGDRYRDRVMSCEAGLFQLHNDIDDTAAFWTGAKRIAPDAFGFDTSGEKTVADRSASLQSAILRLFGGLAALAAVLVLGQVLVRRTLLAASDAPVLRALGMSRGQLVRAALIPAFIVAMLAALIAVTGAIVLSPLTPFGQVRLFEPEPGLYVDPTVLVAGAVAIVAAVLACVAIPAWRTSRDTGSMLGSAEFSGASHPSRTAAAIASVGIPVSAVVGTRLALEPGHGRTATPVRSAIVGLTLAVTAMVAAFGFAASMDRFTSNPALWGIRFDFASGHPFIGDIFQDEALPVVVAEANVSSVTAGNFQEQVGLEGPNGVQPVAMWGTQVMKGDRIDLTMLDGRWPRSDHEIAIGAQTARTLGVGIGDTVQAQLKDATRPLTVVGIPVFPDFGFGPGLGQGAGATMELLRVFYPEATLNLFFARFEQGVDRQATLDRINAQLRRVSGDLEINLEDTATLGTSLIDTRKSRGLPLILAGLFGAVAFATLVHVLVTSVRRRRRDLAILRTIGFRRRQVAATIAWQATTIAMISLLIGVPIGFLVGRFAWALFADRLGVVSVPVEAWTSVAIVVPTVLILANVVAIGPALFARRTQPAQVLRAE